MRKGTGNIPRIACPPRYNKSGWHWCDLCTAHPGGLRDIEPTNRLRKIVIQALFSPVDRTRAPKDSSNNILALLGRIVVLEYVRARSGRYSRRDKNPTT